MDLQDADDWDGFGKTFTEDAVYHEHHYGIFRGRKAILEWLVPVMEYCKGWTYPVEWVAIDGNRVVHKWMNRLPGKRADGSYFEFAGMTAMEYAGGGRFSFQEDHLQPHRDRQGHRRVGRPPPAGSTSELDLTRVRLRG
jgi:hypothetical protein